MRGYEKRDIETIKRNEEIKQAANEAAEPMTAEEHEKIDDDIQSAYDSGDYGDPFNPILPDDK